MCKLLRSSVAVSAGMPAHGTMRQLGAVCQLRGGGAPGNEIVKIGRFGQRFAHREPNVGMQLRPQQAQRFGVWLIA